MTVAGEAEENWRLIKTPLGEPWSGRARYAAAMYFHKAGLMDSSVLEIYRALSRLDDEDPVTALRRYRLGEDWVEAMNADPRGN